MAHTSQEALHLVSTENLQVVLLDVKMPEKKGLSLFKEIKEISPHTSVILMTGEISSEEEKTEGRWGLSLTYSSRTPYRIWWNSSKGRQGGARREAILRKTMSVEAPEKDGRKILAKAWRGLRGALEILGILRPAPQVDPEAQVARLRLYHTEVRKLLSANNSFLETLAELEERRRGSGFIDRDYLKRKAIRCIVDVHAMATSIETISD